MVKYVQELLKILSEYLSSEAASLSIANFLQANQFQVFVYL